MIQGKTNVIETMALKALYFLISRWVGRARVPMPASYQYVKRPKWQTDVDIKGKVRKEVRLMDERVKLKLIFNAFFRSLN